MPFPGLQHVAITVTDLERSTAWYTRLFGDGPVLDEDEESGTFHLDKLGIPHGGIKKASYGSGISFRDPDNIALELFIAPGT